jgi:hypothetical protein
MTKAGEEGSDAQILDPDLRITIHSNATKIDFAF